MKKLLYAIFIFIPIALVVYIVLLIATDAFLPRKYRKVRDYYMGHTDLRLNELDSIKNLDVLFIGSSKVYEGIDPRLFKPHGINVFSLGTGSQTPLVAELLVTNYAETVKPKSIIFELSPSSFKSSYQNEVSAILTKGDIDLDSWHQAFKFNNMKTYNTILLFSIKQLFGEVREMRNLRNRKYINGGFLESQLEYNTKTTRRFKKKEISTNQIEAMTRIIKKLDDIGVNYSFIQLPVTKSRYQSVENKDTFDSLIESFGKFHNFNESVNLVDTIHFRDAIHLNRLGVNVFNPILAVYLKDSIL